MAVILDAINRMLRRWLRSDVSKKILKTAEPEFNPAPPVVSITAILGVRTSRLGCTIGFVFT